MKNIIYAVYHELKWEARSKEVLLALQQIGKVTIITIDDIPEECKNEHTKVIICKSISKLPGSRYLKFMYHIFDEMKKQRPDCLLLHDMPLPIKYMRKHYPKTKLLYDQSELVIDRKAKNIKQYIFTLFDKVEKSSIKHLDLYIAACKERADIAIPYFEIAKEKVVVFDNMHKITDFCSIEDGDAKYGHLFPENTFNIVYGGGIRYDRGTYELTAAMKQLGPSYRLIIAGNPWGGEQAFRDYLKREGISNVDFIGFIARNEWGYLIKKCHASVVFFLQNTVNNKYCASGKMYESLFLHKPILCSSNPPLYNLCKEFECGVASDDLVGAIKDLKTNYQKYVDGAVHFDKATDYESRISTLANQIKNHIG